MDPVTHGATEVVIVSGADKTTVPVATGNTEFHPVYQSLGNFTNEARRSHGDAVMPIAPWLFQKVRDVYFTFAIKINSVLKLLAPRTIRPNFGSSRNSCIMHHWRIFLRLCEMA